MRLRDEKGAIFAEYLSVLILIALGASFATVALGVPFYNLYRFQQNVLLLPLP